MTEIHQSASGRRNIEFDSGGILLRGWLQIPDDVGPYPLVILAHGMGGLKEWEIPAYADAFVAAGIAAMTFDYRNFGDSDGTPREEVDHCGQIEDFQNAITAATILPEIDHARIGLWGTSLGGRNVLAVAALDHRLKCVLAQVPGIFPEGLWLQQGASACSGGNVDQFYRDLADDRRERALGKEPRYMVYQPDPDAGIQRARSGVERRGAQKREGSTDDSLLRADACTRYHPLDEVNLAKTDEDGSNRPRRTQRRPEGGL